MNLVVAKIDFDDAGDSIVKAMRIVKYVDFRMGRRAYSEIVDSSDVGHCRKTLEVETKRGMKVKYIVEYSYGDGTVKCMMNLDFSPIKIRNWNGFITECKKMSDKFKYSFIDHTYLAIESSPEVASNKDELFDATMNLLGEMKMAYFEETFDDVRYEFMEKDSTYRLKRDIRP